MKRMLLTTTMSAMLAMAAPGVASAHHNAKRHHRARHASAHRHHATRARVRTFGSPLPAGSTTAPPTTPATAPSAGGETAGTVASFTGGVLTIVLNNGTTVSGQVTERTEIHCLVSTPPPTEGDDGDDDGGGSEGDEHGSATSGRDGGGSHHDAGRGDDVEGGEQSGSEHGQSCTTAALLTGAVVREAELSVSSAGAVWGHVNLIG
jgi:type II secretory pathway pseudopilin PulG